jgi:hypothetical protein
MAARKEILADLSTKIADGKMREAYRTFEELPVVDQIAVSISPGVGDAIAAYEVGEFGRRAKTNIESGDRLGAAGNIGLSALAGVSLIPLFRFLRGARGATKSGATALDTPTKAKPPVGDPLQLSAPKDSPLPEVEPFQKRPLVELDYRTGGGMDYQLNLGSKTRRWLNGYKQPEINSLKPSEQSKTVTEWIDAMKADNLPEGELKLLRLIDPDGSPSTRLLNETAGNKVISRGFLDDYMQRAQRDALQVRYVPNRKHQSPGSTPDYVSSDGQRQSLYFVRGTGEFRQKPDHYSGLEMADKIRGNNAYVFDADAFTQPGARYSARRSELAPEDAEKIDKAFANINLQTTDNFKEIFRIQSDFVKEATAKRKPKALRKRALIEEGGIQDIIEIDKSLAFRIDNRIKLNRPLAVTLKDFLADNNDVFSRALDYRDLYDGFDMRLVAAINKNDVATQKKILGDQYEYFAKGYIDYEIPNNYAGYAVDYLKTLVLPKSLGGNYKKPKASAITKDIMDVDTTTIGSPPSRIIYPVTTDPDARVSLESLQSIGSQDLLKLAEELIKRRKADEILFNKVAVKPGTGFIDPKQQAATMKKLAAYNKKVARIQEIQAENFRGKKPDSDEIINLLDGLDQEIMDLGVTEFSISPRDIERVTGKPFAESLDKSKEEIFFMTEGPQGGRQKYFDAGPRVEDRVRAYFDDIVNIGTKDIEIANGVKILKKAVAAKTEGLPQGPYFKSGRDKYVTLPIRANILKAYNEGVDGLSIGANQAMTEATQDTAEAVVRNYKDAAVEIKKVLKELGVDEKGVLETVDTGSVFDGTYLKFTPELLDAISKRGINAFKYGGAVDIDAMLAEL